jgi:hypothetical protein
VSADPMKVVSEDGTPIAVWRSGDGPPLVLIHGAAADHNRWAPVLPALEERFTVFAGGAATRLIMRWSASTRMSSQLSSRRVKG